MYNPLPPKTKTKQNQKNSFQKVYSKHFDSNKIDRTTEATRFLYAKLGQFREYRFKIPEENRKRF